MIFSGTTFTGCRHTLDATATNITGMTRLTVKKAVFDDLFITKNTAGEYTLNIPEIWDYDTVLHAEFNGDLFAGNTKFTTETVSHLRIKRREKGSFDWLTLYELPIAKEEDFHFIKYDRLARSGVEYEYAIVPSKNGTEGNMNVSSILSAFEGIFIIDSAQIFHTILNVDPPSPARRKDSNVVSTLDGKYPYTVANSALNYDTGSLSATFIEEDASPQGFNAANGWRYRQRFKDFLFNGKPKILKYGDGRMWLAAISGDITETANGHEQNVITTFTWNECGDAENNRDLFNAGFTDVEGD